MANENEEPRVIEMRDRVASKQSKTSGHLEDQTLDIDARTLALLGKRQRLKVVPKTYRLLQDEINQCS